MKELATEIIIKGSSAAIWDIIMDYKAYHEWNPFIKKISGSGSVGEKLQVTIQPPNQKPMNFEPIVLKMEPFKEFRWKGKLFMKGLFDGEHYFRLTALNENETKLTHGEHFSGIFSGIILKMIRKNTLAGFEEMNLALKNRVERSA